VPEWVGKAIALGVEIFSKLTGKPPTITREAVSFLMRKARLSVEKARRELGYQPRISLEEGMKLTEQWLREAGHLPRVYSSLPFHDTQRIEWGRNRRRHENRSVL
jgi:hypothetical protein